MGKHYLFHYANSKPGQENEFNEWYDGTHLGDVLAVPGMLAATRYRLEPVAARSTGLPPPGEYLAVYEFEGDPEQVLAGLAAAAREMFITPAMGERGPSHVYREITARVPAP